MTNNRPIITAYCLDWHIHTSSAFTELLVKPLAPYADIQLTAWDGQQDLPAPAPDETIIFCQLPPTENWLAHNQNPVIWIPMADAIYYPPNMKQHPAVRVVAFSKSVEKMAHDLGLPYLRMQYYVNPALFNPVSFESERVLLYWNRTGLFHKRFVLQLCRALRVNRLIFRDVLDPRIPIQKRYPLPSRIGKTVIETHTELTSYEDYLSLLKRANIFIAPRKIEGVGIAFLEAMASGCCVIAYNEITMNEYIQHGQNGLLFDVVDKHTSWKGRVHDPAYQLLNKLSWRIRHKPARYPQLTTFQNWRTIRQTDMAQMGANARQSMEEGYARWIASIPTYADFVLHNDISKKQGKSDSFRLEEHEMTEKPLVSIVMGAYNRLEFLKLAIESARQETADIPHEIIVVDGGSDDGSIEWLALQKDVITIIQYNRGEFNGKPIPRRPWGYFMNLGFKSAQADYILMMSDDTIFHKGAIHNAIAFIQEKQGEGRKIGAVPFYFHDIGHEEEHQYKVHTLFGKPLLNHGIYLKAPFTEVGFADEDSYTFYGSDSDICFKLIHAGYEVLPCSKALMLHCPNHPTRYITTSSQQWSKDITALLDKWRGIFVDEQMTLEDITVVNWAVTYVDNDNLARVFDAVLSQSTSESAPSETVRTNDTLIRLEYIENRLNSVLAAVRQNIQQIENHHSAWEHWAAAYQYPFYQRALSNWAIFKPLRMLKNWIMKPRGLVQVQAPPSDMK